MNTKVLKAAIWKEAKILFLFALGLYLFLSLVTYNPLDPSFNSVSSPSSTVRNFGGILGSYLSDLLLQGAGFSSILLALFLLIVSVRIFLGLPLFLRYLIPSYMIFLFSTEGLLKLIFDSFLGFSLVFPPGGILGELISKLFISILNKGGADIALSSLFLFSLLVSFRATFYRDKYKIFAISPIISIKEWIKREFGLKKRKATKIKSEDLEVIYSPEPLSGLDPVSKEKDRGNYQLPPLDLLDTPKEKRGKLEKDNLQESARTLEKCLKEFGITGKVIKVNAGPVITRFELELSPGIKINKVLGLADDLSLALRAVSIRIMAPVPGTSVIGIEVPNPIRETVYFQEIISQEAFRKYQSKLALALGKDIAGNPIIADLAQMPHLLVAGTTGSGKSVAINAMIVSILFKATPKEVRFLMIDPKRLELSFYEKIPHLLHPVVTDPQKAALVLRWTVEEMERRYQLLAEEGVRNIASFNDKVAQERKIPYVVVVIDELADLMMVSYREVETLITRLAQMARAAGIHLIAATQRPSVDVITGLIKVNFPARISFKVASKTDSRTILDVNGAEKLLGKGDMLFLHPGSSRVERIHGAYLSEEEVNRVVNFLISYGSPIYDETILMTKKDEIEDDPMLDERYQEAVDLAKEMRQISISLLQRRLRLGYNRAARIIEKMEKEGIVGPSDGVKPREVLMK